MGKGKRVGTKTVKYTTNTIGKAKTSPVPAPRKTAQGKKPTIAGKRVM